MIEGEFELKGAQKKVYNMEKYEDFKADIAFLT